jgi:hypothetical protein
MWFVTPEREVEPAGEWIKFVAEFGEDQRGKLTEGPPDDWRTITVTYTDGTWSFDFMRYPIGTETGKEELDTFREELAGVEPAVNVQWVTQYLTLVQTVYVFYCSINAPESSMELVREIIDSFRNEGPSGLLYAEGEGWSNDSGHLTWEFSENVTGPWWVTLNRDDRWETFQMELGNRGHRRAFRAGTVPRGLETRFFPAGSEGG